MLLFVTLSYTGASGADFQHYIYIYIRVCVFPLPLRITVSHFQASPPPPAFQEDDAVFLWFSSA